MGLWLISETTVKLFVDSGEYSGQIIDNGKSKFYTSSLSMSRQAPIASLTGFCYGILPFVYLGVPLFKDKPKALYLKPIFDKISVKLGAWKGKILSIMGRVQLVNDVISSIKVYTFHVYKWPKGLFNEHSKIIRNFIWSGDVFYRKICIVSYSLSVLFLSSSTVSFLLLLLMFIILYFYCYCLSSCCSST